MGTEHQQQRYELTAAQGGLYGPKVASSSCFSQNSGVCAVTTRFNDYFVAKVGEVVDQYQPDVLYFDSRLNWIDEAHRLEFAAHYYNM
jgi:alpha-L-fucosidase